MMRIVSVAALVLLSSDAHRVDIHNVAVASESRTQFFENCDELQTIFRTRVANIQALQEAHTDSSTMSTATRARYTMRAFGVVRLLRRARDCPWVVDGNTEDIQHVRDIVHSVVAENPCGDAAMVALSAPAPPEHQLQPLQQALQILYSDNCEPPTPPTEGTHQTQVIDFDEDDTAVSQRLMDEEQQAQDSIDDLMDATVAESAAGSFLQTEGVGRSISRMLGVVFVSILYLLSCVSVGVFIAGFIGFLLLMFPCQFILQGPDVMACFLLLPAGAAVGATAGLVTCGVDLAQAQGNFSQLAR